MNWIDKCSQADECATIENCKISRLLFADDLVLLSSTESGLQRALNSFADACNTAGMKISTAKTEVLHLSRNPDQCVLQVNGATLKQVEKFRYLGRGGVEDTRLEAKAKAKAKDTKKIRGQGQGQGQPFRGQNLSRPRPRTKDTAASVLQKKRSSKKFSRQSPI